MKIVLKLFSFVMTDYIKFSFKNIRLIFNSSVSYEMRIVLKSCKSYSTKIRLNIEK